LIVRSIRFPSETKLCHLAAVWFENVGNAGRIRERTQYTHARETTPVE
jgi:hypothetical protein